MSLSHGYQHLKNHWRHFPRYFSAAGLMWFLSVRFYNSSIDEDCFQYHKYVNKGRMLSGKEEYFKHFKMDNCRAAASDKFNFVPAYPLLRTRMQILRTKLTQQTCTSLPFPKFCACSGRFITHGNHVYFIRTPSL